MIEGLSQILFYLLIIFAIGTGVSYIFYRRSKSEEIKTEKMESIKDWGERVQHEKNSQKANPSPLEIWREAQEEEAFPQPKLEVGVKGEPVPEEFDLKTELEKVFVKKVEKGEIELDLVPVTDARISRANLVEIFGIPWMPKLKYTNPTEKVEQKIEDIPIPREEVDVDAIPEGVVQEPESDKTGRKKKKTITGGTNEREGLTI